MFLAPNFLSIQPRRQPRTYFFNQRQGISRVDVSRNKQMWQSPMARCWRSAGKGWCRI